MATPKTVELAPQLKARIWGGERLARMYGADSEEPIGEAWLVYDGNEVATGRFAGRVFREIMPELGEEFFGRSLVKKYGFIYPLMVKLIDAADWLSVQVHPDDEYAARFEADSGFSGKDEAWLVLDAAPGAQIVYGLARQASTAEVARAAQDGSLPEFLNYVEVKKGDFVYLPAGTIHALGPGIMVAEVSQRSDLTYRLYDYGRGRELHLDKALQVARLSPVKPLINKTAGGFKFSGRRFEVGFVAAEFDTGEEAVAMVRLDEGQRGILLAARSRYRVGEGQYLYCRPLQL